MAKPRGRSLVVVDGGVGGPVMSLTGAGVDDDLVVGVTLDGALVGTATGMVSVEGLLVTLVPAVVVAVAVAVSVTLPLAMSALVTT
jgi:hypothetical protein